MAAQNNIVEGNLEFQIYNELFDKYIIDNPDSVYCNDFNELICGHESELMNQAIDLARIIRNT